MTKKDWYIIPELADRIQCSRKAIWAWIRDGKLKSIRYGAEHRIAEGDWQAALLRFNRSN